MMLLPFPGRETMTYEELGQAYADSALPLIDTLVEDSLVWTGKSVDPSALGRGLGVLMLTVFQLAVLDVIELEEAQGRTIGGFLERLTKEYDNFAFDPHVLTFFEVLARAGGDDLKDRRKKESFPRLSRLALSRIAAVGERDKNWPLASEIVYKFIETVLQTSHAALSETVR